MNALDITYKPPFKREFYTLKDLLSRLDRPRAYWKDIPKEPGIYVVIWTIKESPVFTSEIGNAIHTQPADPAELNTKWKRITKRLLTNIIYIGKGNNLRKRIGDLSRFGMGKADNHRGRRKHLANLSN